MARMRRLNRASLAVGLLVVAAMAVVYVLRVPALVSLEEALFDEYQRLEPRAYDPQTPVRVIDIDEASIFEMGQWPWPRSYIAEIVERTINAGAAVVAFDILFAEPDRTSPERIRQAWARFNQRFGISEEETDSSIIEMAGLNRLPDNDRIFAQTMLQAPVVLGTILTRGENRNRPQLKAGISIQGSNPSGALTRFTGATTNLDPLAEAARGIGSVSLKPGSGTVVRRVPLVSVVGDTLVPALSVEALRVAQGAGSHLLRSTDASGEVQTGGPVAVESMRTGALVTPLDADGAIRVRFSGPQPERIIPAGEILASAALSRELAEEVAGRILLVGSSAPGLRDLVATPLSPSVPGVTVHAEILEQIIAGISLSRPDWAPGVELLALVSLGIAVTLMLAFNLAWFAFGFAIVSVGALTGASWFAFSAHDLLISPVAPGLGIAFAYSSLTGINYVTSERSRREVTRQFEHFVAPDVIAEIVTDPERHLKPGGDRRELTVLFLDVRGFSTLSEKMSPEQVITFINKLLTPLTDTILENQGTIDKYMGDAVMAFWNAPRLTEGHERHAVEATLQLFPALEAVNAELEAMDLPRAKIGVGLNTGVCSVGNMGSVRRLAYSCVGDAVNLASRLEGLTKQYGVSALIGEATAAGVMGEAGAAPSAAILPIDDVAVKGRTQPELVYVVCGGADVLADPSWPTVRDAIAAARAAYLVQDWDRAERLWAEVGTHAPIGLLDPGAVAATFVARIADMRADPPGPDWDGVYFARSK